MGRTCKFIRWAVWKAALVVASLTMVAIAALALPLALPGLPAEALAQDFTVDKDASEALTNYLRHNRLPLVGAQIGKSSSGARRLVLFGYVATDHGKSDAENKAIVYMGSPPPEVVNRIVVQPEIAKLKGRGKDSRGQPSNGSDNSQAGDVNDYAGAGAGAAVTGAFPHQSFDQVIGDIQRYGIKSPPDDPGAP